MRRYCDTRDTDRVRRLTDGKCCFAALNVFPGRWTRNTHYLIRLYGTPGLSIETCYCKSLRSCGVSEARRRYRASLQTGPPPPRPRWAHLSSGCGFDIAISPTSSSSSSIPDCDCAFLLLPQSERGKNAGTSDSCRSSVEFAEPQLQFSRWNDCVVQKMPPVRHRRRERERE